MSPRGPEAEIATSGRPRRLFPRLLAALLLLMLLAVLSFSPLAAGEAPGAWTATTSYPLNSEGTSCASDGSYIYCVGGNAGGLTDAVYSAPLSSTGIGAWTLSTHHYPTNVYLPSCVIAGGDIYCVGGLVSTSTNTNAVYYATVSLGTVGAWSSGTNYPTNIEATSCVTSGGYITCVAGLTVPAFVSTITSAVYYAPISLAGVGAWTETTDYACLSSCHSDGSTGLTDNLNACVLSGADIACMGGETNMATGSTTGNAYIATLSSGAVGATWSSTTTYPLSANIDNGAGSCATFGGDVYCISGFGSSGEDVYYASALGPLGAWTAGTGYPIFTVTGQCVIEGGYIYCTTGETNLSYYSQIGGAATTSSSSSSTTSSSTSTTSSTSSSARVVLVCPSVVGGSLMPPGATFTDGYGNTWVAPSGNDGSGGYWNSYFFAGPSSSVPPPMQMGWGGDYGTYNGQQGWVVTFYC